MHVECRMSSPNCYQLMAVGEKETHAQTKSAAEQMKSRNHHPPLCETTFHSPPPTTHDARISEVQAVLATLALEVDVRRAVRPYSEVSANTSGSPDEALLPNTMDTLCSNRLCNDATKPCSLGKPWFELQPKLHFDRATGQSWRENMSTGDFPIPRSIP